MRVQFGDAFVSEDHGPRHDGGDFALAVERQLRAEIEQLDEGARVEPDGHLLGVRLGGLEHEVGVQWSRSHQGVAGHVFVLGVVGVFHRMMKGLTVGVVGADHEVLRVFHARSFEPVTK